MNFPEQYAESIWNKKDLSAIERDLDEKIVIHSLLGDFHGRDAMRHVVQTWLHAFPDLLVENQAVIKDKNRVVIQWKAEGTHLGEFKGKKPTGHKISYAGVTVYKIKEHKIVEYWAYVDMQHLFNQM